MPSLQERLAGFLGYLEREWKFVLATFAASGTGYLGSAAAPVIVQALLDAGLRHQQAGDLGTIELTMLALTSTLVIPYVPHVSHRKLAIVGTLLAACGLIISAMSSGYVLMVAGRVLTGVGSGLAISGANAAVAAREDAERIFAIIWTMGGAITAWLAVSLPSVVEGGNYQRGFGFLLLLCIAALPLMVWLPPRPRAEGMAAGPEEEAASRTQPGAEASLRSVFSPLALLALVGTFVYALAEQALWQFAYNIPLEAGVPENLVSWIIGFTTLMGLIGGAVAALLGARLGRTLPLVIGSLLSMAGRWVYIAAGSSEWLIAGGLLWGVGFYFVSPYQIGILAAIDRKGRVAVAAGAAANFGYAVGPTVGGRVLEHLDHMTLIVVVAGATLLSLLLLLPLAIRVDRAVTPVVRAVSSLPSRA